MDMCEHGLGDVAPSACLVCMCRCSAGNLAEWYGLLNLGMAGGL
jgi:hypothetical protein